MGGLACKKLWNPNECIDEKKSSKTW